METKMVKIPFNVELAKKITNSELEGKIVTRGGKDVRIICFDREDERLPIVGLVKVEAVEAGDIKLEAGEMIWTFHLDGMDGRKKFSCHGSPTDLMLEVPEYTTFKDGDVYTTLIGDIGIYNSNYISADKNIPFYVGLIRYSNELVFRGDNDYNGFGFIESRLATDEEKQRMIDALKASERPKAKEYLKSFFGIKEKKDYEFKPFDKVLVRSNEEEWRADIFSHVSKNGKFSCVGYDWNQCLPYNEQTAHLLGTSDNYE